MPPLRLRLEEHLEVVVTIDGVVVEALPVDLGRSRDLHDFCEGAMNVVRHDRACEADRIEMSFRYREPAGV